MKEIELVESEELEQISFFDDESNEIKWKSSVLDMLNRICIDEDLPDGTFSIVSNYTRDGKKIASYSIAVYEQDFPSTGSNKKDITKSTNILNIKEIEKGLEIAIPQARFSDIEIPSDAEIKEVKSDKANKYIQIDASSTNLVEYLRKNTEYVIKNYVPKASGFGCCSRYNECSEAKKCIHPNKLYSKACQYRSNLESGKIFFGKNRNID